MLTFGRSLVRDHSFRCRAGALVAALVAPLLACQDDVTGPQAVEEPPALTASASASALSLRQVSSGWNHTCGVTTDNRAYCWGYGWLGNGTGESQSLTPVAVAGGLAFRHVSVGSAHTCGVATDNRAYCWGFNDYGSLGDGSTTSRATPVTVQGGIQFRQVSADGYSTCGLATDNRILCWGSNGNGQLGDGTTTTRVTPVPVSGGLSFRFVSAGTSHTCGVTQSYQAYCWGSNGSGQLGDNSTAKQRLTPTLVAGGRSYQMIDAGSYHTCAVTTGSRAFCWGQNGQGQVGDGTHIGRWSPRAVTGQHSFSRITAGTYHTCAETTNNKAYCWGHNRYYGALGDGTTEDHASPVAVAGDLWFTQVSAGSFYTCGVNDQSQAYCWGSNENGELGDGTTADRPAPGPVAGTT